MKYSELIRELNYWKEILDEEDPEIVIGDGEYSYKINIVNPVEGITNDRAIGINI